MLGLLKKGNERGIWDTKDNTNKRFWGKPEGKNRLKYSGVCYNVRCWNEQF
jgi:hypothetical protein